MAEGSCKFCDNINTVCCLLEDNDTYLYCGDGYLVLGFVFLIRRGIRLLVGEVIVHDVSLVVGSAKTSKLCVSLILSDFEISLMNKSVDCYLNEWNFLPDSVFSNTYNLAPYLRQESTSEGQWVAWQSCSIVEHIIASNQMRF